MNYSQSLQLPQLAAEHARDLRIETEGRRRAAAARSASARPVPGPRKAPPAQGSLSHPSDTSRADAPRLLAVPGARTSAD